MFSNFSQRDVQNHMDPPKGIKLDFWFSLDLQDQDC